jgi:hypothetical protein
MPCRLIALIELVVFFAEGEAAFHCAEIGVLGQRAALAAAGFETYRYKKD